MKTMILVELAILVAAGACGSARGATTDTGTGSTFAYSSRQQVQCKTVTMPDDQTVRQIRVACTNPDDLPLVGSCSKPGVDDAILGVNGPAGWEGPGAAAEWVCSWVSGGDYVNVPGAEARICCVVKTQ